MSGETEERSERAEGKRKVKGSVERSGWSFLSLTSLVLRSLFLFPSPFLVRFIFPSCLTSSPPEETRRGTERKGDERVTNGGWEGSFIAFATRALHAPPTSHKKSEETE